MTEIVNLAEFRSSPQRAVGDRAARQILPHLDLRNVVTHERRNARRKYWQRAEYYLKLLKHQHQVAFYAGLLSDHHGLEQFTPLADRECSVDGVREAFATLLLTPAPTQKELKWKRAHLASPSFPYLPVKREDVERQIARDDEYLARVARRMVQS